MSLAYLFLNSHFVNNIDLADNHFESLELYPHSKEICIISLYI